MYSNRVESSSFLPKINIKSARRWTEEQKSLKTKTKREKSVNQSVNKTKMIRLNRKKEKGWDDRFIFDNMDQTNSHSNHDHSNIKRSATTKNLKKSNDKAALKKFLLLSETNESKFIFKVELNSMKINTERLHLKNIEKNINTEEIILKEKQELLSEIEEAFSDKESTKYALCEKKLLKKILELSDNINIGSFIRAHLVRTVTHSSTLSALYDILKKRRDLVILLQNKNEPISKEEILEYQKCTLKIIEKGVNWKEEWEINFGKFCKNKKHHAKIELIVEGKKIYDEIWNSIKLKDQSSYEGNPFLLGYQGYPTHPEFLVKIRACEMLLLEEKLEN